MLPDTSKSLDCTDLPHQSLPRTIQAGDLVIVYESINSLKAVVVDPSIRFENRFGSFAQKVSPAATRHAQHPCQPHRLLLLLLLLLFVVVAVVM